MSMRSRIVAVCALAGALSCSLNEPVTDVTLAISLGLSAATVPTAGTVDVTMHAQNYGTEPLTLSAPGDCLLFFQIHDPNSVVVYRSADDCFLPSTTHVIAPGEAFDLTRAWDGRGANGTRLVGGTYVIRAGAVLGDRVVLGAAATINVE